MSSFRDKDYLQRMIKQLADALARAMKLRKEKRLEAALQALGDDSRDILGVPREVLDSLDARSAAALLGEANKVRTYAKILAAEAEIREELGEGTTVLVDRVRALEGVSDGR